MSNSVWLPFLKSRKLKSLTQSRQINRRAHHLHRNTPVIGAVEHLEDRVLLTSFWGLEVDFLKDIYDHISTVTRGNETEDEQATHAALVQKGSEVTGYSTSQVSKTLGKLEKYFEKVEEKYGDELRELFDTLNGNEEEEPPSNSAPTSSEIAPQTVIADTVLDFDASTAFSDEDADDELTYAAKWDGNETLPSWVSFDSATGKFSGTPSSTDTGTFSVEVSVTDKSDATVSETFSLTISQAPSVLISDVTFNEANAPGNASFTVSLDAASSETISVTVTTTEGTAKEGSDYTETTQQVTFNPGETEHTVDVPILADSTAEATETFTLAVQSVDQGTVTDSSDTGTGTINDNDPVTLTLDLSQNTTTQSNGTLVTSQDQYTIQGQTEPGAVVDVARDADGTFNDGSTTADNDGNFQIIVDLVHNDDNLGAHQIQVRSTFQNRNTSEQVDIHYAIGTVARLNSSLGSFDVELFNSDAPKTVANFLSYFDDYSDSIIHRSISNFIIQGGGFEFQDSDGNISPVPTDAPIENEFSSNNLNVRGTLSTALQSGNIDSFTSGWFLNTVDNSHLDNVPHTVFGRVIGTGMDIVDAIEDLQKFNLNGVYDGTAFQTVPLTNYTPFSDEIDGTVSIAAGSNQLTGVDTLFLSQLQNSFGSIPGSAIQIGNEEFIVSSITDNNTLVLNKVHTTGATDVKAKVHSLPLKENLVIFNTIEILIGIEATV